jgi:L-fuconolactonase
MVEKPHTTVESRMAGISEAWLASTPEEVIEPDLPIIDPHHHFWDFPTHRYLLDQLFADTGSGHNIQSTVFIECAAFYRPGGAPHMRPVGEVEFVNGQAAMAAGDRYGPTRAAAGIVGTADLTIGATAEECLAAQVAVGGGRFKGIRYIASWEDKTPEVHNGHNNPPQHLYRDHAKFREGFKVLGRLGLTFDAWLYHPQLPDLVDLARSFPEQKIVLNHVGGPLGVGWYASRRDEVFADWSASIKALAESPNVCVKLGGLGMRICGFAFDTRPKAPSSAELADSWRPYVETCIEAFGPARCMFESNFPVDKVSGSYRNYWNAFKRLASGASASEKADLFAGTARRFYSLP